MEQLVHCLEAQNIHNKYFKELFCCLQSLEILSSPVPLNDNVYHAQCSQLLFSAPKCENINCQYISQLVSCLAVSGC